MTDPMGLGERLRAACIDWNGEPEVDGAEPVRIPTCGTLREAADALDAKDTRLASQAKLMEEMRGPRIFVDCEFNGWMGELLSFAMVAEDGREFYAVLPEPRILDEWCFENVLPVLGKPPVASYDDFRLAFIEFLRGFDNPVIVADWPADLYHFNAVLLGRSHTESVLRPCRMQLVACDYYSAIPHNALEDARAIKVALSKLESQP